LDAEVVVLGDSVTQDAFNSFRIADDTVAANLTTNKASGLIGSLFLVRRYLARNKAPRHVLLAATPGFLTYVPDGSTYDLYIHTVFTRASERKWLKAAGLRADAASWTPAVLKLDDRIAGRILGWLRADKAAPFQGTRPLKTGVVPEAPGGNAIRPDILRSLLDWSPRLGGAGLRALGDLCGLLNRRGITLHIAWAPVAKEVHENWRRTGLLKRFASEIQTRKAQGCGGVRLVDFNDPASYPTHAFRDENHLRRPGWLTKYGFVLRSYILGLRRN
jgi:hypothetical protein